MKSSFATLFAAIVTVAVIGVNGLPNPQTSGDFCIEVCQTIKPTCPAGEAPTGSEGCWGCCQPVPTTVALAPEACNICVVEKPVCKIGEIPTGHEGCWGCCVRVDHTPTLTYTLPVVTIKPASLLEKKAIRPCDIACQDEKPQCIEGEEPTGGPGCWGCCQPPRV